MSRGLEHKYSTCSIPIISDILFDDETKDVFLSIEGEGGPSTRPTLQLMTIAFTVAVGWSFVQPIATMIFDFHGVAMLVWFDTPTSLLYVCIVLVLSPIHCT